MRSLARNVMWGITWGLRYAAAFAAVAILIFVVRGRTPFEANNITVTAALLGYVAAGIGGGVILGLLRPLTRSALGSGVTGVLIATVLWVGGRYTFYQSPWTIWDTIATVMAAGIWGGLGGTLVYDNHQRHEKKRAAWRRQREGEPPGDVR